MTRIFFLIYRSRYLIRYMFQRAVSSVRNGRRLSGKSDAETDPQPEHSAR